MITRPVFVSNFDDFFSEYFEFYLNILADVNQYRNRYSIQENT
jgi:hypothetical protein